MNLNLKKESLRKVNETLQSIDRKSNKKIFKISNPDGNHAICAGFLSLWFTDWKYCKAEVMHGILMGVVVEGISFYGIGELSLFLVSHSDKVNFTISLIPSILVVSLSFIFYLVS